MGDHTAKLLILDGPTVAELLPMADCIDTLDVAFRQLGAGSVAQPLRSMIPLASEGSILGVMPGKLGSPAVAGLKVISVVPQNHEVGLPSHLGVVLLFDADSGQPLALLDASELTATRTAAASGLATRLLARQAAGDLAVLGAGVQGRSHIAAMAAVRPLRRIRLWSRTRASAERLANRVGDAYGPQVEVFDSPAEATAGADLVCTVTASSEPILEREAVATGCHINAVGACTPTTRELTTGLVGASRLFVDCYESALAEAGDLLIPMSEGALGADHILADLGELTRGEHAGRSGKEEITLFKSLGIALEDLAAAALVYERARERGLGVEVGL